MGDGESTWVVLDPIDGSNNAKRGTSPTSRSRWPWRTGPRWPMCGSATSTTSARGGRPRVAPAPSSTARRSTANCRRTSSRFWPSRRRRRGPSPSARARWSGSRTASGSWARSRSRSADRRGTAGRRLLAQGARSVDIAAARLLVRERGLAIELFDGAEPFGAAPLGVEARSRVAAAEAHRALPPPRRGTLRVGPARPERPRPGGRVQVPGTRHARSSRRAAGPTGARWARAAKGADRLLRLELRSLAGARVPEGVSGLPLARALRDALRHGRGERDLLPAAAPPGGRSLGRADAAGFVFTPVKANRYLTHIKRLTDLGSGVERFYASIEPLTRSPKLGPSSGSENPRDDERLAGALAALADGRRAFEFRPRAGSPTTSTRSSGVTAPPS